MFNNLLITFQTGDSLEQRMSKAAENHKMKTWIDFNQTQNQAISLFTAAAKGDIKKIDMLNDANYHDVVGIISVLSLLSIVSVIVMWESSQWF